MLASTDCYAVRFMRQPNKTMRPRPVRKRGSAAGSGVTVVDQVPRPTTSVIRAGRESTGLNGARTAFQKRLSDAALGMA
jgi:hypothetical protein